MRYHYILIRMATIRRKQDRKKERKEKREEGREGGSRQAGMQTESIHRDVEKWEPCWWDF